MANIKENNYGKYLNKKDLETINNMTKSQKKEFVKNIENRYLSKFKNNLSYWISIYDLIEAIKMQKDGKGKNIVFITPNKKIAELYKNIKQSTLKIKVINIK